VYAEPIPATAAELDPAVHVSTAALSAAAAASRVYLIGGSIPERAEDGRLYNTAVAFGPDGAILARHRKMHLFDIDIPGRMTFRESATLSAGSSLATFATPWGVVGLGICYDLRFPYLALLLRQAGARLLIMPGAFNMTTGPAHWELLLRARAVESQAYVLAAAQCGTHPGGRTTWGHAMIIDPWGVIVGERAEGEGFVVADLDPGRVAGVRASLPSLAHRRIGQGR